MRRPVSRLLGASLALLGLGAMSGMASSSSHIRNGNAAIYQEQKKLKTLDIKKKIPLSVDKMCLRLRPAAPDNQRQRRKLWRHQPATRNKQSKR